MSLIYCIVAAIGNLAIGKINDQSNYLLIQIMRGSMHVPTLFFDKEVESSVGTALVNSYDAHYLNNAVLEYPPQNRFPFPGEWRECDSRHFETPHYHIQSGNPDH